MQALFISVPNTMIEKIYVLLRKKVSAIRDDLP